MIRTRHLGAFALTLVASSSCGTGEHSSMPESLASQSGALTARSVNSASVTPPSLGAAQRHHRRFSPKKKPVGVPDDFVLTRNGFMHPSCVFKIESDETVDHDGAIRGPDGNVREVMPPCAHERYSRDGRIIAKDETSLPAHRAHSTYDGWIAFYEYDGSIAAGTTLTADWVVPASPVYTAADSQDIAFFNDIETQGSELDILQPVLDYNSGVWSIESEHCCIGGNDAYNAPATAMAVGDTIRGTVKGSNCSSNGSCSTWTVITQDVTKNVTATLTVTNAAGTPVVVHPAVLETYGVTACNMLPASGKVTFANNSVTNSSGSTQALSYYFGSSPPSGYPACGYSGNVSGNNYTLIFGTSVGGNTSTGGASGTGGTRSTGGTKATGGSLSTGGTKATGGAPSTGGSPSTGGAKATGGAIGTGGANMTGGATSTGGTKSTGGVASVVTGGTTAATGGVKATGGVAAVTSGGLSSAVGSSATGGAGPTSGGSTSSAVTTSSIGGSAAAESSTGPTTPPPDVGSCSCRQVGRSPGSRPPSLGMLGLIVLGLSTYKRRTRRRK